MKLIASARPFWGGWGGWGGSAGAVVVVGGDGPFIGRNEGVRSRLSSRRIVVVIWRVIRWVCKCEWEVAHVEYRLE